MEEKFILRMLRNNFLQYGRSLIENPLSEDDYKFIIEKITAEKDEDTEWYEVIEDVVYAYFTNQE